MKAGRELDALVAEKVMGLTWNEDRCRICGWPLAASRDEGCAPGDCSMRPSPARRADEPAPYSTDIAAAWEVVERMCADGWEYEINSHYSVTARFGKGHYEHWDSVWHGPSVEEFADTAPHAICLAALAAADTARTPRA